MAVQQVTIAMQRCKVQIVFWPAAGIPSLYVFQVVQQGRKLPPWLAVQVLPHDVRTAADPHPACWDALNALEDPVIPVSLPLWRPILCTFYF